MGAPILPPDFDHLASVRPGGAMLRQWQSIARRMRKLERVGTRIPPPVQAAEIPVTSVAAAAGAGPWPWDYLVSPNYTGVEGAAFSVHGHTFYVFSSAQAAVTDGVSRFTRSFSIGLTPGTHAGGITFPVFTHTITFFATGGETTGTSLNGPLNIGQNNIAFINLRLPGLHQIGGTSNMTVRAKSCSFFSAMEGDHSLSHFEDCSFAAGWKPLVGETPVNVTIVGGRITNDMDFQTNSIPMQQWIMKGVQLDENAQFKLFSLNQSQIDVWKYDGGGSSTAIPNFHVSSGISHSTVTFGVLNDPGPDLQSVLLELPAGTDFTDVFLQFLFGFPESAASNANTRFVKVQGGGVARGWQVRCSFGQNIFGDWLEDKAASAPSVEFDDAQGCKFTLTPHDKAKVLINAGSDNVVDSGVIDGASVGTDYAPPADHQHTASGDGGGALQPADLRLAAAAELTIAGGAVTLSQSHHTIDTEADAGIDFLETATGLVANQLYFLRPASPARTVVFSHAVDNILCIGGEDIALQDAQDFVWAYSPDGAVLYVQGVASQTFLGT